VCVCVCVCLFVFVCVLVAADEFIGGLPCNQTCHVCVRVDCLFRHAAWFHMETCGACMLMQGMHGHVRHSTLVALAINHALRKNKKCVLMQGVHGHVRHSTRVTLAINHTLTRTREHTCSLCTASYF